MYHSSKIIKLFKVLKITMEKLHFNCSVYRQKGGENEEENERRRKESEEKVKTEQREN